jgi:hypothetical protein
MTDGPKNLPFDGALYGLKRGARMRREAWGSSALWVMLLERPATTRCYLKRVSWAEVGADIAAMDITPEPFFLQRTASGFYVAWTPTTTDILANDWREYLP